MIIEFQTIKEQNEEGYKKEEDKEEKAYNNIVFSKQLFDYPLVSLFREKENTYLLKYDRRSLFLFKIEKENKANFIRRFIFYNYITKFHIFKFEENIFIGILFEGNLYSVLKFCSENYILKGISYFNFKPSLKKLKISHFEKQLKIKYSKNFELFYLIHNVNKVDLFCVKKKPELNWLFNIKEKNNNFIMSRKNHYFKEDLFFEKTLTLNFKEIMSEVILDIVISNFGSDLMIYLLISKPEVHFTNKASEVSSLKIYLVLFIIDNNFIKKLYLKKKINPFDYMFKNNMDFLRIKDYLKKFWLIESSPNIFLFQAKDFLCLINHDNFSIIAFEEKSYSKLREFFRDTKILYFKSKIQGRVENFSIKQLRNHTLIKYNEITLILNYPEKHIDLFYLKQMLEIEDIILEDLNNIKVVFTQRKNKIVKNLNQIENESLEKNKLGIRQMIKLDFAEDFEKHYIFGKQKIIDFIIKPNYSYLIENFRIWKFSKKPFGLIETKNIPLTFIKSWDITYFENNKLNKKILLIDIDYNFYLFDSTNNIQKIDIGFSIDSTEYLSYNNFNDEYLILICHDHFYIINKRTVKQEYFHKFEKSSMFSVLDRRIYIKYDNLTMRCFEFENKEFTHFDKLIFQDSEKEIIEIAQDLENLYVMEKKNIFYKMDRDFKFLNFYDLNKFPHTVINGKKNEEQFCSPVTDLEIKIEIKENFEYPEIGEINIFNFKNNKYLLVLLQNKHLLIYKFFEDKLIRLDLNIPISIHSKRNFLLEVKKEKNYVLIILNHEKAYLLYFKNDIENFKSANSELVFSFILNEKLYTLGQKCIKIFKYENIPKIITQTKEKIHRIVALSEFEDTNKNHFLVSASNSYDNKENMILLISHNGEIEFKMKMQEGETITQLKALKDYVVEKYAILLAYTKKRGNEYYPKWKIMHIPISTLGTKQLEIKILLEQSSQEKNQKVTNVLECYRILFICLETTILQIEGHKISRVYNIHFYSINRIAQKDNYFLFADIKDSIKFSYFQEDSKELIHLASISLHCYIKSISFLKESVYRFITLDNKSELSGYSFCKKDIFNKKSVFIEKIFSLNFRNMELIRTPEHNDFSCILINRDFKISFLKTFEEEEFFKLNMLCKQMESFLPFTGGCSPIYWLKNQKSKTSITFDAFFIDFFFFHQFLNLDYFLKDKISDIIAIKPQKLIQKIQRSRQNVDIYL